jgi:tetratricopeptide (TPR) repeat protein
MAHRLQLLFMFALLLTSLSRAQTAALPTLKDANALLAASKNAEAAAAFQSLVSADGSNLSAWLGLGQSQENLGETDKALASYTRVIELSPKPGFPTRMAMLSIAGVYAVKGDQEKAYLWLGKLADSHPASSFLAILGGAKEFESLKEQPRFKRIVESMKPCNSPEFHQFDFWIGSWEVQNPQGQVVGHNDVNRVVGGCVLQENWTSSRGFESGTSFNFYDYRDNKWHQDYYDNSGNMGNYPPLAGELRDGRMVLLSASGIQPLSRWTWYEISPGKVRQMAEQSTDGGKSWSTTWDSVYVKK